MDLLLFWKDHGSEISNGAVVLSAIAAFAVISSGRNIARKRGTLDLILHIESDEELTVERDKFIALRAGSMKLDQYGADSQRNSEQAKAIRKVLNLHELTSVAIQEGVINERVFRRWFNRAFIDDYKHSKGYIDAVRSERRNPAIFKEFEVLANRWDNDRTYYADPSWLRRKWWAFQRVWWA